MMVDLRRSRSSIVLLLFQSLLASGLLAGTLIASHDAAT